MNQTLCRQITLRKTELATQNPNQPPGVPLVTSGVLNRAPERPSAPGTRSGAVANPDAPESVDRKKLRGNVVGKFADGRLSTHQLRALGRDTRADTSDGALDESRIAPMSPDELHVVMHVLGRQTENRLLVLQRDVAECKSVDEAANFTRWLRASGVLALLEKFSTDGVLPVNGKNLRKLSEAILSDCGDLYRNGKATPRYAASDIAEINRKLDIIAAHIGKNE